jgi:hypothetical protein
MRRSFTILLGFMFILFACEKDNNKGDGELTTPDVSGFWIVTENLTGNCEGEEYPQQETIIFEIEQSDSNLTFTIFPDGDVLDGTIVGNTIKMDGEFSSSHGTNAISFSGTVGGGGTVMNGSGEWEWYSDYYSCSGTAVVTGEKAVETNTDFSGQWQGNWVSEEYDNMEGTFSVVVTQSGNSLTGNITVPEAFLLNAELEGQIHGNIVYFGDVGGVIKFVGTANNNSSSGNYTYPFFDDEGSWTAVKSTN